MKTSMKFTLIALMGLLYTGTISAAKFTRDSSVTLASQYLFRGFDMTQDNPALQGDYGVTHESGLWFGAWGSMYEFADEDGIEIDIIAGYSFELTDDLSFGVGYTGYNYTGETEGTNELNLSLSYKQYSISYNDDFDLDTVYISLDAEFELVDDITHEPDYNASLAVL